VAVQEERRAAVLTAQPRDEVRAIGVARVQLALDPGLGEQSLDVLDARPLVARWVRRVEPDEVAEQLDRVWNGYSDDSASSSRSTSAWVL
jgi:hypothetical protein